MAFPSSPTLNQEVEEPAGSGNWFKCTSVGPPAIWERIPGPTGAVGRYENTYTGATWTVGHNLGQQFVSVQTVDNAGNVIIGDPTFTSNAVLTLDWGGESVSGTAVIRR